MTIAIYCGDSWEPWTPENEKTGIGGSEEAVINMSRELTKLGHKVTVFNHCADKAGNYDGVEYVDYLDWDEDAKFNIFVGWRTLNPWKVAIPGKNYDLGYHWLHDTSPEDDVLQALALGAKKIMCLSKYHRRLFPRLRNEEVFITRNGINPAHFKQKIDRVPHRIFYGSSYDRGLKELLEEWPKIKLAVPEATLHIAYGWETMKKMFGEDNQTFKELIAHIEELMQQDGVTHLGRIGHEDVAREMLEADVWGYPTWWPEISCITAMKAQAAGTIPVVIPTAAVAETIQHGFKTDRGYFTDIHGNITQPGEVLEQWTNLMIAALTMPDKDKDKIRKDMKSWALSFYDWATVAKQWSGEFEMELLTLDIKSKLQSQVVEGDGRGV